MIFNKQVPDICVDKLVQNIRDPYIQDLVLITTNPLKTADLLKMLHIFAVSTGILLIIPLILQNSLFSYIISSFLNKIILKIKTFYIFFHFINPYVLGSKGILLQTGIKVHF